MTMFPDQQPDIDLDIAKNHKSWKDKKTSYDYRKTIWACNIKLFMAEN